ncbi:hypothetical protein [Photobacterium leiognathi]|uniref:hypothetical protein n=1 Tax=Photobacterium leiognathi TaxID=553611 RepID=UPI0029820273|nr:hypothetical protein [Photobacterium leiognathi]
MYDDLILDSNDNLGLYEFSFENLNVYVVPNSLFIDRDLLKVRVNIKMFSSYDDLLVVELRDNVLEIQDINDLSSKINNLLDSIICLETRTIKFPDGYTINLFLKEDHDFLTQVLKTKQKIISHRPDLSSISDKGKNLAGVLPEKYRAIGEQIHSSINDKIRSLVDLPSYAEHLRFETFNVINWIRGGDSSNRIDFILLVDDLLADSQKMHHILIDSPRTFERNSIVSLLGLSAEQLEKMVDDGQLIRKSDITSFIKNKYNLPSFSNNNLTDAIKYNIFDSVESDVAIGLSLLPLRFKNDLELVVNIAEGSYFPDIYLYVHQLGRDILNSHLNGMPKSHRREIFAKCRFLFNRDVPVNERLAGWADASRLTAIYEKQSYIDSVLRSMVVGLIGVTDDHHLASSVCFDEGFFELDVSEMSLTLSSDEIDEPVQSFSIPVRRVDADVNFVNSTMALAKDCRVMKESLLEGASFSWPDFIPGGSIKLGRFTLHSISSVADLLEEGALIGNCLSTYLCQAVTRSSILLSLREESNRIATIELVRSDQDRFDVLQIETLKSVNQQLCCEINTLIAEWVEELAVRPSDITNSLDDDISLFTLLDNPVKNRELISLIPNQTMAQLKQVIKMIDAAYPEHSIVDDYFSQPILSSLVKHVKNLGLGDLLDREGSCRLLSLKNCVEPNIAKKNRVSRDSFTCS